MTSSPPPAHIEPLPSGEVYSCRVAAEPEPPVEGMIFDIGRSGAPPSTHLATGNQVELLHLDSGFYISVPRDIAVGRPQGDSEEGKERQR